MSSIRYGIILANDLTAPDQAIEISEQVAPYVDGIKIGVTTILNSGVSLIKNIKELCPKTIIADFKVADIGFRNKEKGSWEGTNAKIVEKVVDAGADYIICHSIIGISSIQECIEVAHSKGAKVLTLPYMTHKGAELFFSHPLNLEHVSKVFMEYGVSLPRSQLRESKTISDALLVLGDYFGVDGFIGPANNVQILKEYRKFTDKEIFGPGIGRQATDPSTPKEQLRVFYEACGARSAAIIGSAIYSSSNPADAAKQFADWRNQATQQ